MVPESAQAKLLLQNLKCVRCNNFDINTFYCYAQKCIIECHNERCKDFVIPQQKTCFNCGNDNDLLWCDWSCRDFNMWKPR